MILKALEITDILPLSCPVLPAQANFFTLASCRYIIRPAYLYRFLRDIPILAFNHDFPISCGGVPILEDAGIFSARIFLFGLFSPVFPNPPRILHLPPIKALRCRYK